MSDELFLQQKEIIYLKKQILKINNQLNNLDVEIELNTKKERKKPPHY